MINLSGIKICAVTALLSFSISPVFSRHNKDSSGRKRWSILPVPGFGYAPETKAYIGAVCLVSGRLGNDTNTRPSNLKLELNYSQRKQVIGELGWNAFTHLEKCFTSGKVHFSKFPDYFWLNSQNGDSKDRILFSANRSIVDFNFLFRFSKRGKWYAGPGFRHLNYVKIRDENGQPFLTQEIYLKNSFSPAGLVILKDSRDNILNASKGWFIEALSHYMIHENTSYLRWIGDVRTYIKIDQNILALRAKHVLSRGPALDAANFGGDENVRGFYYGRYRPFHFTTMQAEARVKVYRRWGLVIFGGSSYLVFSHLTYHTEFKHNAGAGIRFVMDRKENINLRLDYAIGSGNNSGFYVAFGEAF